MPVAQQLLKRATRSLVGAVGGGDAASSCCRYRQQKLSAVGNANLPGEFMAIDVVADLEELTRGSPGWPQVTRALARAAGFELVALPDAVADADWLQHIAAISKEAGDCISKIALAAADGSVSPADVRAHDLVREFDELIRVAVEGRARVIAAEQVGE